MGGISDATIAVDCDRCGKKESVPAGERTDFYRAFAARGDDRKDECMFTGSMAVPGLKPPEEEVDDGWRLIEFEYLCPKCIDTVNGYMDKIAKSKSEVPGKDKDKDKDKGKDESSGDKTAAAADDEKKDEEKAPKPRNSEPEETEENKGGDGGEFDESELFDEDD